MRAFLTANRNIILDFVCSLKQTIASKLNFIKLRCVIGARWHDMSLYCNIVVRCFYNLEILKITVTVIVG